MSSSRIKGLDSKTLIVAADLPERSMIGVAVKRELTFAISVKSMSFQNGCTVIEVSERTKFFPALALTHMDYVSHVHYIKEQDAACITRDCEHESHPDAFVVAKQPVTFLVNDYSAACAIHRHKGPSSSFFCLWCLMELAQSNVDPGIYKCAKF